MIEYSPNRDWFRDIRHLGTSWTLRRIVRAILAVGVYAAALSFVILRFDLEGHRSISGTFSLLGLILGVILVFRTNSAYDRWWEGRKHWGALVNHSRNLAIGLDAMLPAGDLATRSELARLIGGFALALSGHLRGKVDLAAIPGLLPGTNGEVASPPGHVPAHLSRAIFARVQGLRRDGVIDGFDVLLLKPHTQAFLDIAGACERIRKTPIPFSYSVFIKLFVLLYAAILPLGLVPDYGYFAVPMVMLLVFALLGLELMAEEIEDPFGLDCNDLPTETIARTIGSDVAELLRVSPGREEPAAAEYSKVF